MATAAKLATPLHPETTRLLALDAWTADPIVGSLFAAIRDLDAINLRLRVIGADRPGLCWQASADVGRVDYQSRETGRIHSFDRYAVPSGACAELWKAVKQLRDDWIEARCKADGLRPDMAGYAAYAERRDSVELGAVSVDAAWASFQRGVL